MQKEKKHTLREIVVGKIMLMVWWHGIYTEENIFVRTSTQKGDILIENRHWRDRSADAKNIIRKEILWRKVDGRKYDNVKTSWLSVNESESQLKSVYKSIIKFAVKIINISRGEIRRKIRDMMEILWWKNMLRSEDKIWRKKNCSGNTREWKHWKICLRKKLCKKNEKYYQ